MGIGQKYVIEVKVLSQSATNVEIASVCTNKVKYDENVDDTKKGINNKTGKGRSELTVCI